MFKNSNSTNLSFLDIESETRGLSCLKDNSVQNMSKKITSKRCKSKLESMCGECRDAHKIGHDTSEDLKKLLVPRARSPTDTTLAVKQPSSTKTLIRLGDEADKQVKERSSSGSKILSLCSESHTRVRTVSEDLGIAEVPSSRAIRRELSEGVQHISADMETKKRSSGSKTPSDNSRTTYEDVSDNLRKTLVVDEHSSTNESNEGDSTSKQSSLKTKIASTFRESDRIDQAQSGNLKKDEVASLQSPTVKSGVVVEETSPANTLKGTADKDGELRKCLDLIDVSSKFSVEEEHERHASLSNRHNVATNSKKEHTQLQKRLQLKSGSSIVPTNAAIGNTHSQTQRGQHICENMTLENPSLESKILSLKDGSHTLAQAEPEDLRKSEVPSITADISKLGERVQNISGDMITKKRSSRSKTLLASSESYQSNTTDRFVPDDVEKKLAADAHSPTIKPGVVVEKTIGTKTPPITDDENTELKKDLDLEEVIKNSRKEDIHLESNFQLNNRSSIMLAKTAIDEEHKRIETEDITSKQSKSGSAILSASNECHKTHKSGRSTDLVEHLVSREGSLAETPGVVYDDQPDCSKTSKELGDQADEQTKGLHLSEQTANSNESDRSYTHGQAVSHDSREKLLPSDQPLTVMQGRVVEKTINAKTMQGVDDKAGQFITEMHLGDTIASSRNENAQLLSNLGKDNVTPANKPIENGQTLEDTARHISEDKASQQSNLGSEILSTFSSNRIVKNITRVIKQDVSAKDKTGYEDDFDTSLSDNLSYAEDGKIQDNENEYCASSTNSLEHEEETKIFTKKATSEKAIIRSNKDQLNSRSSYTNDVEEMTRREQTPLENDFVIHKEESRASSSNGATEKVTLENAINQSNDDQQILWSSYTNDFEEIKSTGQEQIPLEDDFVLHREESSTSILNRGANELKNFKQQWSALEDDFKFHSEGTSNAVLKLNRSNMKDKRISKDLRETLVADAQSSTVKRGVVVKKTIGSNIVQGTGDVNVELTREMDSGDVKTNSINKYAQLALNPNRNDKNNVIPANTTYLDTVQHISDDRTSQQSSSGSEILSAFSEGHRIDQIGKGSSFHEIVKSITRITKQDVSLEDKSGYIYEDDFDTSFSDNLSYVEEDLVEEKIHDDENENCEKEKEIFMLPGDFTIKVTSENATKGSNDDQASSRSLYTNNFEEIKSVGRQQISLEDDFVLYREEPSTSSANETEEKATSENSIIGSKDDQLSSRSSYTNDIEEIKSVGRQHIPLEDDFVLHREESNTSTLNGAAEKATAENAIKKTNDNQVSSRSSYTNKFEETKNIGRKQIPLEDDFVLNREESSANLNRSTQMKIFDKTQPSSTQETEINVIRNESKAVKEIISGNVDEVAVKSGRDVGSTQSSHGFETSRVKDTMFTNEKSYGNNLNHSDLLPQQIESNQRFNSQLLDRTSTLKGHKDSNSLEGDLVHSGLESFNTSTSSRGPEICQSVFTVESSICQDEVKNFERRAIAIEDNFRSHSEGTADAPTLNRSNMKDKRTSEDLGKTLVADAQSSPVKRGVVVEKTIGSDIVQGAGDVNVELTREMDSGDVKTNSINEYAQLALNPNRNDRNNVIPANTTYLHTVQHISNDRTSQQSSSGSEILSAFSEGQRIDQIEKISSFHEIVKGITRITKQDVSLEDKSGYICEDDFDTSFSDNLSYVEEDLVEEKIYDHDNENCAKNTNIIGHEEEKYIFMPAGDFRIKTNSENATKGSNDNQGSSRSSYTNDVEEIKSVGRQQIPLEDDFILHREESNTSSLNEAAERGTSENAIIRSNDDQGSSRSSYTNNFEEMKSVRNEKNPSSSNGAKEKMTSENAIIGSKDDQVSSRSSYTNDVEEMKRVGRQQIPLEDDFILHREESNTSSLNEAAERGTSENAIIRSNDDQGSSRSSYTNNFEEMKSVRRQQMPLEDHFVLHREESSTSSTNGTEEKATSENAIIRNNEDQISSRSAHTNNFEEIRRSNRRKQIPLEDDFLVEREESSENGSKGATAMKMRVMSSEPKSFKEIIFGNVDVVALAPGKDVSSVQTSRVKDSMLTNEYSCGENSNRTTLQEQLIKSKQKSNSLLLNRTSTMQDQHASGYLQGGVLHNEFETSSTNSSCQEAEISQPIFKMESSITVDEVKNVERRTVALEDDFKLPSEETNAALQFKLSNIHDERDTLKDDFSSAREALYLNNERTFGKQPSTEGIFHGDKINNCGNSRLKVDYADEYMIDDPADTLSDIRYEILKANLHDSIGLYDSHSGV